MQNINEVPTAEVAISVTPNTSRSRPPGDFIIGNHDIDTAGPPSDDPHRGPAGTGAGANGTSAGDEPETASKTITEPPPPPVTKVQPTRISEGVINGKATYLPKPQYTEAAKTMGVQGEVSVQVTLDESGKVISAKAMNGHVMLRGPSEKAAWAAKFSPTYLSKVAVKVTGIIVYRFTK
jgi:TonB family protein